MPRKECLMHIAPASSCQSCTYIGGTGAHLLHVHHLGTAEYAFLLPQAIMFALQYCHGLPDTHNLYRAV